MSAGAAVRLASVTRPAGPATMSPSLQRARNYYGWISDRFRPLLGVRVLDVGGGHGPLLDHVVHPGRSVTAVDLSRECVLAMRRRFAGADFRAEVGDITDPTLVAALRGRFDTVLCVNVLEHIERDDVALRAMAEILRPAGGRLLLMVPAHPLLYGTPDALAGHHRRYSRAALRRLLRESGFQVESAAFFNPFGALPYLVNSRLLRPRSLGGAVDAQLVLFDRFLVPVLRRLDAVLRLPFGQSLVAVGRAREPA